MPSICVWMGKGYGEERFFRISPLVLEGLDNLVAPSLRVHPGNTYIYQ